jgi:hypothetical protein
MRLNRGVSVMTAALLFIGRAAAAQQPPPIDGVTGTVSLEGTVQKTYEGAHTVIVKAMDGVEHLFHLTERTVVHGGKAAGDDVLRAVDEGSKVVVHYTAEAGNETADEVDRVAADGLKTTEGIITNVDRRAKTMSIRVADGSEQTLRLTERAAADIGNGIDGAGAGTAKVIVYVNDEAGRPVAHYFKRVS